MKQFWRFSTWSCCLVLAGAFSGRAAPSVERCLAAYWSFDETGGTARDYSGNGHDLRIPPGVSRVPGVCGGALRFRGRESLLCAPADDSLFFFPGDYTVSVWVKHTSRESQCYISKWKGKGDRSAWWLGYFENKAQFGDYFDGGQARSCAMDVADGKWHQVTGVRRGNTACLYVDGRLVAHVPTPARVAGYNTAPVMLGAFSGRWPLNGALDEVRLYCRALAADEIRARYERIRAGRRQPVRSLVANGPTGVPTRLMLFPGPDLRTLHPWYPSARPFDVSVVLYTNKSVSAPWRGEVAAVLSPQTPGTAEPGRRVRAPFVIPKSEDHVAVRLHCPTLPPGRYTLTARVARTAAGEATKFTREFAVIDLNAAIRENREAVRKRRGSGDPFARGIISAYAGLLWTKGRPDVDRTLARIRALGVNCYTYLISGSASDRALAALPDFCAKAAKSGLEVWAYLVPPTEAPVGRNKPIPERKYPPFDMDYLKWAAAIARIAADHPNLTLWMIDDFDGNTGFFTVEYTKRIYQTSKRIAPALRFGVCVYYDSIARFMKAGYGPWFDAVLWGYQHSISLYPDAGISAKTLPIEIHDYYRLCPEKILIPCIYFTAHSSWPRGRPTREYLTRALCTAFEQTGICWVFTTPPPGSWKADLVRKFCRSANLPLLPATELRRRNPPAPRK